MYLSFCSQVWHRRFEGLFVERDEFCCLLVRVGNRVNVRIRVGLVLVIGWV